MKEKEGFKMVESRIHSEISELFVPYLNKTISRKEIRMLEEHLTECVECQEQMGIVALVATQGRSDWKRRNVISAGAKISPSKVVPFRV